MQSVAVGWQIYSITHRPLDLGLAGLAQFLPAVCLFLWAGHVSDRIPRKRILLTCISSFAVCSALLLAFALHGIANVYPIYAVLLLQWRSAGLQRARRAIVLAAHSAARGICQRGDVELLGISGLDHCRSHDRRHTLRNGRAARASFTARRCAHIWPGVAALSRVQPAAAEPSETADAAVLVLAGLRYIWHNKLVLGALSLDLFAVLLGGAVALLPVYAREILRVGASGLGLLRSAPGIGAILTSLLIAHWPLRRKAGYAMFWCVFAFGLFTVVFGLSRNLALSLSMLLLLGAADTISVIVRSTMIQLTTPDAMRGRVSAVNMVFIGASNEVGQFESGLTAHWFGTVPAVVLGGLGTMFVVCLWAWLFPSLRTMDRLDAIKTEAAS